MEIIEASRKFIYRNARPLDLARWHYLFENGSKQPVIDALSSYQNPDGGFANALEPDCWNPNSLPIQTWVATRIIDEIELNDKQHPLITYLLNYLETTTAFDGHCWHGLNNVSSNNEYPHAPWWSYDAEAGSGYNPTASLIGFILKYADKTSSIYNLGIRLLIEAYDYLKANTPLASMHETACFVELYDYLTAEPLNIIDLNEFKALCMQSMKALLTFETSLWDTTYSCKPSLFIKNKKSDFYPELAELCAYECKFIKQTQNVDGTWNVTWDWGEYPREWSISENWWKSDIIIKNIKFLKSMI